MREGWFDVALGDICTLTKGSTPTQKRVPGEYPLIVTAAEPLTSKDYQFEGHAVCVPMVSSTGHGHASLKRVHYASGRFAVANIIIALQARPGSDFDMKYLWLTLDHGRDELIVPLMKGTANVSLSQQALADARVVLPPLLEQRRIIDLIGALDDTIAAAQKLIGELDRTRNALTSVMSQVGEPVSLSSLGRLVTGSTPSTKVESLWEHPEVPFVTPGDLPWTGSCIQSVERFVDQRACDASTRLLEGAGVLQVCIGATVGKVGVVQGPALFNQQINAVFGLATSDALVLGAAISSPAFQAMLQRTAGSSTMPLLSKSSWGQLEVAWPPDAVRPAWAALFRSLAAAQGQQQVIVRYLRTLRCNLLDALLSGEHQIPESYDELTGA